MFLSHISGLLFLFLHFCSCPRTTSNSDAVTVFCCFHVSVYPNFPPLNSLLIFCINVSFPVLLPVPTFPQILHISPDFFVRLKWCGNITAAFWGIWATVSSGNNKLEDEYWSKNCKLVDRLFVLYACAFCVTFKVGSFLGGIFVSCASVAIFCCVCFPLVSLLIILVCKKEHITDKHVLCDYSPPSPSKNSNVVISLLGASHKLARSEAPHANRSHTVNESSGFARGRRDCVSGCETTYFLKKISVGKEKKVHDWLAFSMKWIVLFR